MPNLEFSWIVLIVMGLYLWASVKVLAEYERGVIFRLGRVLAKPKGPGLILVFWPIDRIVRVSLRIETMEVPPQEIVTHDNVTVKVNAVVFFRVIDPNRAILEVASFLFATSQKAQTTLRSVLGQVDLDSLLGEREKLNQRLQEILDEATDPWGIKVTMVEVKGVELPPEMIRAIAKQAEAERERRAKIIHAQGELQAADQLSQAAALLSTQPTSVTLRYLQTLTEIGVEKNTTIVFPIPIDLLTGIRYLVEKAAGAPTPEPTRP